LALCRMRKRQQQIPFGDEKAVSCGMTNVDGKAG
jgi:hypothetical protein